jgi:SAM-dependent methyltransferase
MNPAASPDQGLAVSPWVARWLRLVAPESSVLDVACGSGRHTRLAAGQGHRVVALDRNVDALAGIEDVSGVVVVPADIETDQWPLAGQKFDAVVVTNYLHRPLFPELLRSVSDTGLLIYETFARGNERFGRPSNPDFLLDHGELYERVHDALRVLGYEDVYVETPKPAMVQRICACGPCFHWPSFSG